MSTHNIRFCTEIRKISILFSWKDCLIWSNVYAFLVSFPMKEMIIIFFQLNIRYLNPLFLAYDDRLRDRDEAIKKFQVGYHNTP